MPNVTKTFTPLLGKRMRVTTLDTVGTVPSVGTTNAALATDGFITVSLSAEIEEGVEIITKKASGALCVNEKFADSFKRFNVEMEFCGVNPSLLAMVSNARTYADYNSDIAGFTIREGEIVVNFALELWTGLSGAAIIPGQPVKSGYMLMPFLSGGTVGDMEVAGEDAINFSVTGTATKGSNKWGVGPYKTMMNIASTPAPAALPQALDPFDHLLMMETTVAPPTSSSQPIAMPA